MAFRRPLKYDTYGNLKEWSDTEITYQTRRLKDIWYASAPVGLTYTSSGGNLGTVNDTRLQAGASKTYTAAYPTEAQTAEPTVKTVGYSRINQYVNTVSAAAGPWPLYWAGSGSIREMSLQDVKDTFGYNTIQGIVDDAGTYQLKKNSSSQSGWNTVSTTAIYKNTQAKTANYTAAGITETLDQPITMDSWYLLQKPTNSYETWGTIPKGVYWDTGKLREVVTDWSFWQVVAHMGVNDTSWRIRYKIGSELPVGGQLGVMTDTRLNGSGNYQTRYVNTDDYRAQEFPNGTATTVITYRLKIYWE
jgi:hypothetical protein